MLKNIQKSNSSLTRVYINWRPSHGQQFFLHRRQINFFINPIGYVIMPRVWVEYERIRRNFTNSPIKDAFSRFPRVRKLNTIFIKKFRTMLISSIFNIKPNWTHEKIMRKFQTYQKPRATVHLVALSNTFPAWFIHRMIDLKIKFKPRVNFNSF